MSSISSRELAASASGLNEPECEPSHSARSSHSAAASSPSTGQASRSTRMSASSPPTASEQMALPLMSSVEGSPARTSALPDPGSALKANAAAYGRNTPVSFAKFDRATSSWRTFQHCLIEGLTEFSGTWPRSGSMQNGIAFQLPPLAQITSEIDSGLLPTHTAGGHTRNRSASANAKIRYTLVGMARHGKWPTPTAVTDTGGAALCKWGGAGARAKLRRMVSPEELNGALNPTWVEWLMGFPLGWTDCGASATPSSRKSRKSSGGRS